MKVNNNIKWLWYFVCIAMLTATSCKQSKTAETENIRVKAEVSTEAVHRETITQYLNLNAVTAFQKKDNIRSTITGYVTGLTYKPGDYVENGAIYCYILTKEQKALRNAALKDSAAVRFKKPMAVYCNASGIIASQQVIQGDYTSEGDVMAVITEPASLVVMLNVPYEYHQLVYPGKKCEILLPDGSSIMTSIKSAIPSVDAASQSQIFIIALSDHKLPENLNVTVKVEQKSSENAIVVKRSAIQSNETQDEFWVMKMINDSMAIKSPVVLGLQNDSMSEIIGKGIRENDRVITKGAFGLPDSSLVKTTKPPR